MTDAVSAWSLTMVFRGDGIVISNFIYDIWDTDEKTLQDNLNLEATPAWGAEHYPISHWWSKTNQ